MHNSIVIGGGSWGTALAHLLASRGHAVRLLLRQKDHAAHINQYHTHPRYLAKAQLNPNIIATADPNCIKDASLVVLAVPCQQLRTVLEQYSHFFAKGAVLINTAKGIEMGSHSLPLDIVRELLPNHEMASLSGPSFALEVVLHKPTAVVLASHDNALGTMLRNAFSTDWFRTYSSNDVRGVELGGAVKNVIAIAVGISDGLDYGLNTRAALITRGLAEITRLGVALGAHEHTFMGLSGLGDLMLTCTGDLSRNRQVGLSLAKGLSLEHIVTNLGMVAEGVATTKAVCTLADMHRVDMPVTKAVYGLLYEGHEPHSTVQKLMGRELKDEHR